MIDFILIRGVPGVFQAKDGVMVGDGDYLRLPDGMMFRLVSFKPRTVTELVSTDKLPDGAKIVDVVDRGF